MPIDPTPLRSEVADQPMRVLRANDPDVIDLRSNVRKCLDGLIRTNEVRGEIQRLDHNLSELAATVAALVDKVEGLERVQRPRASDPLPDEIVKLLERVPGVRLSAVAIADNIGADAQRVANRMSTLVQTGRVQRHQLEGHRSVLFSSVPKE